jgi:hypothetical protein
MPNHRPTPRRRQTVNLARVATPECLALQPLAGIPGDMIRSGWLRNVRSGRRGRPYAVFLLARVVYRYTPVAVFDNNGQLVGYERRFEGDLWVPDWQELAEELGCSLNTIRAEQRFLESRRLIRTQPIRERTAADGARAVREAVAPIAAEILAITDLPAIQETGTAAVQETGTAAVQETGTAAVQETGTFPISPSQEAGTEKPAEREGAAAPAPGGAPPRRKSAPELLLQHADPRVQTYIDVCRPEGVTRTNAEIIMRRAENLDIWRFVCEIWRASGWNADNFGNMFNRYEREARKASAPAPRPPAGDPAAGRPAPGVTANQQAAAEAIMRAAGVRNGDA